MTELAARFETPLYLYDFDALEERGRALRTAVPPRFDVCFAVKANPSLAVVRLLADLGFGADVASRGELLLAQRAGVAASRVVFSGPAKSDRDLLSALAWGILGINVEGLGELDRLQQHADRLGIVVPVQLRLGVAWSAGERQRILGGAAAGKFGIELASAQTALAHRARWPRVRVQGFQVFNASNVLSAERWVRQAARVVDLSVALARRYGVPLSVIDLGGGLGIPYAAGERALDLTALGAGLRALAAECARVPELAATRLLLEPGRYLVGPAGIYVARVVECKRASGRRVATLDGGVHHFLRPALLGVAHPAVLVAGDGRVLGGRRERWQLSGPLCTSLDTLASSAALSPPRPGDLVAFLQAGAYGFTESMPLFLSHEWPAELGRRGGRVWHLRRSPSVAGLLAAQCAPEDLVRPTAGTPGRSTP